ncbi:MAG: hypothetical protein RIR31_306, partial [Bacteroidota bacterium]
MKLLLKLSFFVLLPLFTTAQQSRVDSIVSLLGKSKTTKGLDTAMFNSARNLISTAVLTDAH